MSANPYDLRAGLLNQAQDILAHKYHSRIDNLRTLVDLGVLDPKTVTWPDAPTTEEVIAEATKLYKFVQTK